MEPVGPRSPSAPRRTGSDGVRLAPTQLRGGGAGERLGPRGRIALVFHTRRSRQLAQAQMDFVANVSHELRTPLTVIRGAAHNIKRGVVQERAQLEQYSGLIIQHAEQLTEMIEQLLELAGARKNQAALTRKPVQLVEVLQDAHCRH